MTKAMKDILALALGGLVIGVLLGILAAGGYATWVVRGDMANIGFGTIFAFVPWEVGYFGEPFRTALMVGSAVAAILTVAVPALGFRKELTSHGTARWAEPAELKRQGLTVQARVNPKKGGLVGPIFGKLGKPWSFQPFLTSQNHPNSSSAIPNCLVDGPPGAGKGVGIIIPTLLTYWGSVIVFDPKGENFAKTARRRKAMGDRIFRFDPYAADRRTHRYNPLTYVAEAQSHERLKEAKRVAASLIVRSGKEENFLGGARDIFAATSILMVHRGTGTIAAIYDALTQAGGAFKLLAKMAEEADEAGIPEAAGLLRQYAGYEAKVLSSYMSVLFEGGLSLWADPVVRAATSETDFRIETLRQRATSVYVTVSPNDLEPLAPLVRVLFQQAIGVLSQREPIKRRKPGFWARLRGQKKSQPGDLHEPFPVLFVIDEFASLGKLQILIRGLTWLRGYGGRMMIVIQSLASVREIYGRDGAEELLGLCGIKVFMSPSDKETPEYISKAIGDRTRPSESRQRESNSFKRRYNQTEIGEPLMRPEQIRMIGNRKVIALIENSRPVLTNRITYFEDRILKRIFNSQKGESPMPTAPLQINAAPAPPPNYQFYDVDTNGMSEAPLAAEDATTNENGDQAGPIKVPAATPQEVPQPSRPDPNEDHDPVIGHSVSGEDAGPGDDEDDDDLPPEKERVYHKQLSHVSIEASHLNAGVLHILASQRASRPERLLAKNYFRQRPLAGKNGATTETVPSTPKAPSIGSGGMNLGALKAARAKARGASDPGTASPD